MEELSVRKATPNDAYPVIGLIAGLLSELDGSKAELDPENLSKVYAEFISNDNNRVLMAFDREKPVGVITLIQSIAIYAQGKYGIINEFYVLPEYRCRGVGKLLIAEAVKFGKSQNWRRIEVGAPDREKWRRSIGFYLREGFVEIGPRLKRIDTD
jgi:GNAT superfamily N-acetyltransferase